jgi:Tfp pilus assembly protein PilN
MIKINLLGDSLAQAAGKKGEKPEEIQVYVQEDGAGRFSFPIAGILVGLAISSVAGVYYVKTTRDIETANATKLDLETKKKELEKYTSLEKTFREQKDGLAKKQKIMMSLKSAQHLPVHLMEELANALPDNVWFEEITRKEGLITIKGEASTFEMVQQFRNRLMAQTTWFKNVQYPAAEKGGGHIKFNISFELINPA